MNRLAYALGTWFGCGRIPKIPGTAGTIGAIPLYLLLRGGGTYAVLLGSAVATVVGIWAASRIVEDTGNHDPQIVVIDEVAGVLLTLAFAPNTWAGLLVGFVLFRVFDQFKPWPARPAERLPRGWGVVMDDVVAGAWGAVVMVGLKTFSVLDS